MRFLLQFLIVICICWGCQPAKEKPTAVAKQGVLDLRDWNFERDGLINLDGEWEFTWNRYFVGQSGSDRDRGPLNYFKVPDSWNKYLDPRTQKPLGAYGYGSFRLKILLPSETEDLAIRIPRARSSYRIAILDASEQSVSSVELAKGAIGLAGVSEPLSKAATQKLTLTFKSAPEIYIVWDIANFHLPRGGPTHTVSLGSKKAIVETFDHIQRMDFAMIGILFMLGIYNLALFLFRTSEKAPLWLGLTSLNLAVYTFVDFSYLEDYFNPESIFAIHWKIDNISLASVVTLLYLFFASVFTEQCSKIMGRLLMLYSCCMSLYVLMNPPHNFVRYILITEFVGVIFFIYIFYILFRLVIKKRMDACMLFFGFSAIILTGLIDILDETGKNSMSYGFVIFMVSQALVIAYKNAEARKDAENLLARVKISEREVRELNESLEGKVRQRTQDIRSILDNIKIGIFSVSDPILFTIDRQRSKSLKDVMGADPDEDYTLDSLLLNSSNLDKDSIHVIHSCIASSLGENIFTFEINAEHLPHELTIQRGATSRIIELDWSVTLNSESGTVERILVSCRDATDFRTYQEAAKVQGRELSLIEQLIATPHERFIQFHQSARKALLENRQIMELLVDNKGFDLVPALKIIFMNLHTIKGTARMLGFKELSFLIHNAEEHLVQVRTGFAVLNRELLLKEAAEIEGLLEEYATLAREKLNRTDTDAQNIILKRSFLRTLVDRLLKKELLEQTDLIHLVEAVYVPAMNLVNEAKSHLPRLAKDLEKPEPRVHVKGFQDLFLDHESYIILSGALVHLIRNSMDHGIESPSERLRNEKPEAGSLFFEASTTTDGDYRLDFSDDGRGLALAKIKALAIARGAIAAEHLSEPSDIAELIFREGFTTSPSINEISGRGIGMGAVREFIGRLGGRLQIEFTGSLLGNGNAPFKFSMHIPAVHMKRLVECETVSDKTA